MPPMNGDAKAMGRTGGWGAASKVVKWGVGSPPGSSAPSNRIQAPRLPIASQ